MKCPSSLSHDGLLWVHLEKIKVIFHNLVLNFQRRVLDFFQSGLKTWLKPVYHSIVKLVYCPRDLLDHKYIHNACDSTQGGHMTKKELYKASLSKRDQLQKLCENEFCLHDYKNPLLYQRSILNLLLMCRLKNKYKALTKVRIIQNTYSRTIMNCCFLAPTLN